MQAGVLIFRSHDIEQLFSCCFHQQQYKEILNKIEVIRNYSTPRRFLNERARLCVLFS